LAPTAALADALSTAFYVLGLERTRQFCAARPEIGAILVCPARGSGGLAIHAIGPAVERFAAPVQP
jgi:thiamine biosynthesis lipoprotein